MPTAAKSFIVENAKTLRRILNTRRENFSGKRGLSLSRFAVREVSTA